jgi:hypothetical protein
MAKDNLGNPEVGDKDLTISALRARVAELERIPAWMTDYHDIHGHYPSELQIRDQFNIKR